MDLDFQAETAALREKSPWNSRVIIPSAVVMLLIATMFFVVGVNPELRGPAQVTKLALFAVPLVTSGMLLALAMYLSNVRFIQSGQVMKSDILSRVRVGRSFYRVTLEYECGAQTHRAVVYVPYVLHGATEGVAHMLIAVNPKRPRQMAALYHFAKFGQSRLRVLACSEGLIAPRAAHEETASSV